MTLAAKSLLALAASLALGAPAAAQPGGKTDCFLTRDMRNHTVADDHTLYVDVGGRSVYRVTMSNNCLSGATSSDAIVLRDFASTGRVCNRLDFDVSVHGSRCIVDNITKLTPAEAAALPKKLKP